MIELGLSKLALIGAVALIVIGPERLPRVARTVGAMLGKAQRYVADVKAEVNRSMELDELRKMKDSVENAARDVETAVHDASTQLSDEMQAAADMALAEPPGAAPSYQHPRKNWRLKRGAMPQWYKARSGIRRHALSGAARVARYRPRKFN